MYNKILRELQRKIVIANNMNMRGTIKVIYLVIKITIDKLEINFPNNGVFSNPT